MPFEIVYRYTLDFIILAKTHTNISLLNERLACMVQVCKEVKAALCYTKFHMKEDYKAAKKNVLTSLKLKTWSGSHLKILKFTKQLTSLTFTSLAHLRYLKKLTISTTDLSYCYGLKSIWSFMSNNSVHSMTKV